MVSFSLFYIRGLVKSHQPGLADIIMLVCLYFQEFWITCQQMSVQVGCVFTSDICSTWLQKVMLSCHQMKNLMSDLFPTHLSLTFSSCFYWLTKVPIVFAIIDEFLFSCCLVSISKKMLRKNPSTDTGP